MSNPPLPRTPHPIASAFFDAHDVEIEASAREEATECSRVDAIRNSLGWRTRHASSQLYPVSVLPVAERRWNDGEEVASFHVRQVFPSRCDDEADASENPAASVRADDCEYGTGATVWPGTMVLVKYLEKIAHDPHRSNILAGKSVIDLGCGTAITSISSALLGASVVVCSDGCDPVVALARRNIRDAISVLEPGAASGKESSQTLRGCKMIARTYRWGEGLSTNQGSIERNSICNNLPQNGPVEEVSPPDHQSLQFDVILGADCIVPQLYPIELLVHAIDELSGPQTVCYLSYEQRHFPRYNPAEEFKRLAVGRHLVVDVVPESELDPMYSAQDIQIWRVTREGSRPLRADGLAKGMG